MMPTIDVPSIWDYLGQAGQQGIQSYQQAKERTKAEELQKLGLLSQLFQQGAIGSQDIAPAFEKYGIHGIFPNAPERARDIVAHPEIKRTSDERKLAGLPSLGEQAKDTMDELKGKAVQDFHDNKDIDPRVATLYGLPTNEQVENAKILDQDKVLSSVANTYIDAALAPLLDGSRIPRGAAQVAAKQANEAYQADRAKHGLPPRPEAANYFTAKVLERMTEQWKLENQEKSAENSSSYTPQDRHIRDLDAAATSAREAMRDMATAQPELVRKINKPQYQNDPNVIRYLELRAAARAAEGARARAVGLPAEIAEEVYKAPQGLPGRNQVIADRIASGKASWKDLNDLLQSHKITENEANAIREQVLSRRPQGR